MLLGIDSGAKSLLYKSLVPIQNATASGPFTADKQPPVSADSRISRDGQVRTHAFWPDVLLFVMNMPSMGPLESIRSSFSVVIALTRFADVIFPVAAAIRGLGS